MKPPFATASRLAIAIAIALASVSMAHAQADGSQRECGEVIAITTHGGSTTRYAYAAPAGRPAPQVKAAVILLAGGGGHLNLDDKGCPRQLTGNSLVRSIPEFHRAGFATALVDAPSDHFGEDGLAGFRAASDHAKDLGKIIVDVRARTHSPVWLIGTSRGSISAANAAARLSGTLAPDGVVLTSALMVGSVAKKSWVAQTLFDVALESIHLPVLVIGHASDNCLRSPANLMDKITARTNGAREQVVTVTGGPRHPGPVSIAACEGRTPHGFIDQESEVAAGIARFIEGGNY